MRTANDLKGKYVHYPSSVITKAPHIGLVEDVEEINLKMLKKSMEEHQLSP
jgi:hypothetical protein